MGSERGLGRSVYSTTKAGEHHRLTAKCTHRMSHPVVMSQGMCAGASHHCEWVFTSSMSHGRCTVTEEVCNLRPQNYFERIPGTQGKKWSGRVRNSKANVSTVCGEVLFLGTQGMNDRWMLG